MLGAGDGCWLWTGFCEEYGYGSVHVAKVLAREFGHARMLAHRAAYALTYGPIPGDLCVLHRCDNPPCVRPDHLFLGTRVDNMHDMIAKGRHVPLAHRSGEQHGMAKLTWEQVREIRRLLAEGKSHTDISRQFGADRKTIYNIHVNKQWKLSTNPTSSHVN